MRESNHFHSMAVMLLTNQQLYLQLLLNNLIILLNKKVSTCMHATHYSVNNINVASQMMCLTRLFPLLIGKEIPETCQEWQNYLLLLKILDIVFAPVLTLDVIAYLRTLISDHHQSFKCLYPLCQITPKIHYRIHYPHWISK